MKSNMQKVINEVLGREKSFLDVDIIKNESELKSKIESSRILVIGAAGSIGAAFVRVLVEYQVGGLHLIDISENNLAEVVRDFRSSGTRLPDDFRTYSIDFSAPEMEALLKDEQYDYVLNFSALKHVRSERDPYTLMRMLEVNVTGNARLLKSLSKQTDLKRVFSVSSDKSVRPANLMGASKAFMERVFIAQADQFSFSSARFANVAFSDGSLLHSFRNRIEKRQPLTAPHDVLRYFITHEEAGQLCLLGCFLGENREVFYPQFRPDKDMMSFADIAKVFLRVNGHEPLECSSEQEALEKMTSFTDGDIKYPCFFSGSDTSGEKMFEEFNDPSELVDEQRFKTVGVVTEPSFHGVDGVEKALSELEAIRASGKWSKSELLDIVKIAVPELNHVETQKNLDQKM